MTPAPPPPAAHPMAAPDALLYGLVQGVTEFLPVSSSTHLTLLGRLLGTAGRMPIDEAYVMLLHLPTLAAVVWVLRREIKALLGSQRALLRPLALATLVTGALGFPLNDAFDGYRDSTRFLGGTLIITGLILLLVERLKPAPKEGHWTWDRGVAVGLGQALAGIPGLSRMGMSTAAGMLTGRGRVHAVAFSFLCAIPVTLGKTALECHKALKAGEPDFWTNRVLHGAYALGALVAFFAGLAAFRWILKVLGRRTLVPFGIYCAMLGLVALTLPPGETKMPDAEPAAAPTACSPDGTQGDEPNARNPGPGADGRPPPAAHQPPVLPPGGSEELPPPEPAP